MAWVRATELAACPPGRCLELVVAGHLVALFNVNGTLYALDGVCPHQGGPLAKGELTGTVITCPWHGWQFDVRDGQHQFSPSVQQPRFAVRVEDEVIWVAVPDGSDAP